MTDEVASPPPTAKQKKPRSPSKKRANAGTSKSAAEARREAFIAAYLENGRNATQAAITAGFSPHSAYSRGLELVKDREIKLRIEEAHDRAARISGLELNRTLMEVARVAYGDPRKLFTPTGQLVAIHELDDDTAAMVASVEHDDIREGRGEDQTTVGTTTKVRLWDKNAALEKAMKFHGAYEKDNAQRSENLNLQVVMVAAPGRQS